MSEGRAAWTFQSVARRLEGLPTLLLELNPSTVSFTSEKRLGRQQAARGTTFFFGTLPDGTNNDVTTLAVSGTSGNVVPPVIEDPSLAPAIERQEREDCEARLRSFQELWRLSRGPMFLDDGLFNRVTLTCFIPGVGADKGVVMEGFFSGSLQVTANASSPRQLSYSFNFVALRSEELFNFTGLGGVGGIGGSGGAAAGTGVA